METTNYESNEDEVVEVAEEVVEETTEEPTEESEEETTVDWEARALKAERAIEKSKKKAKDAPKKEAPAADDAVLSRLETRGVMEADDQNYVLRFAKDNNVNPVDALKDDIVIDRLAANEKARTSVDATPRSNNRANTTQDEVGVGVKKYEQSGELPDGNPALTSKILKRLSGRG